MVASAPGFSVGFVGRDSPAGGGGHGGRMRRVRPARVIWVEGVAGSGKTTLVRHALADLPEELRHRARAVRRARQRRRVTTSPASSESAARDSPFAAAQQLLDTWAQLQEQGPVAVLVEDVHWADAESSLALISAVRRLDQDRVLLVITSRPEAGPEWDRLVD